MSETRAVQLEQLVKANAGQGPYPLPLCPGCIGGRLHPYRVLIPIGPVRGYSGLHYLEGWVAVCVGDEDYKRERAKTHDYHDNKDCLPPCGFSMPMVLHQQSG